MSENTMLDGAPQGSISCDLPTMPLASALQDGSLKSVLLYTEGTVQEVASEQIANPDISRQMDEEDLQSSLRTVVSERALRRFDLSKYEDATDEEVQGAFVRYTQTALTNYCDGLAKRGNAVAQTAPCSACGA